MSSDFNVNHIPYRFFCDKLTSLELSNNLIIESSDNNIEFKSNNETINFNNNTIFNYGLTLNNLDLSNVINITGKTLNIDTLFVTDIARSQATATIIDTASINFGYIRATTIGYNPNSSSSNTILGRSNAYFTYINVSGGDSSFNNSVYIINSLDVSGATTISNDLIVNGKSYVTLYNTIVNYIPNIIEELSSNKILALDLSARNISISNDLVVRKTSFLNELSINGLLLDSVLKVPSLFTIQPTVPIVYNFQDYSWTSINSSYTGLWRSVCWSPALGMFVSVIFNNNNYYVLYSYNGKVWFPGTPSSYNARSGVCWSHERSMFVAVGYELMYSYDGITWSSTNVSGVDASISWNAPCWSPELSMFVASSNGGTSSNSNVMYSYNGINWTQTSQIIPNNSWSSPCWSPQLRIFVAVAQTNTNNVMYSDDGKNWTLKTATANSNFKSVCWSAELVMFVAVAQSASNNIMYSYDGIDWTTITFGSGWYSVCWSAQLGIFLAMTSYGSYKVMYSYNGINWSQQNIVTPENGWFSICWSPELKIFLGVGNTSNVMISSLRDISNSGTLIINGDLMVYGNNTIIASSIVEISDVAISLATNLINANDLYSNNAGLNIQNVASIKYNGLNWNFVGGQLTVENKKVAFDVSFIEYRNYVDASLNNLNSGFDLSYNQLKTNNDSSFNGTYSRTQIDASFITYSNFEVSYNSFRTYVDNSYVDALTFDASFGELKTYLDASYILKSITMPIQGAYSRIGQIIQGKVIANYQGRSTSVSINYEGNIVAIGTDYIDSNGVNTGANVRVYKYNDISWTLIGDNIDSETTTVNNYFGNAVSLNYSGNIIAIGAIDNDIRANVRVYRYVNDSSWIKISQTIDCIGYWMIEGFSISLNSNGNILAIGGPMDNRGVRVFQYINDGSWTQLGIDFENGRLGRSISLNAEGTILAVGSLRKNNRGEAIVYRYNDISWIQISQTITGLINDRTGTSVSLNASGNILAVSSPNSSIYGYNSGIVRVYKYVNDSSWIQLGQDNDIVGDVRTNSQNNPVGDKLGISISLNSSGNILAVSAPDNGINGGVIMVYKYNDISWVKLDFNRNILDTCANTYFGTSLALNALGNRVIASAPIAPYSIGYSIVYDYPLTFDVDNSRNFLRDKLDLSYVLKSTFDSSYAKLKEQIEISFSSVNLTNLYIPSISVETISTRHYSQKFNNILWNQIGLDISI